MRIGIVGINHKSSELAMREHLMRALQRAFDKEGKLAPALSAVLLSTCNRSEVYFSADDLTGAHSVILAELRKEVPFSFEHKLYSYFGLDCFHHLATVTAGLDSAILAESEIQRQVKMAYQHTTLHYPLASPIHFLFQKSLKIGKQVRSSHLLKTDKSIEGALYHLSTLILKEPREILFIGNSEINRKIIHSFARKGFSRLSLATRAVHSASTLPVTVYDWSGIDRWNEYDLVIAATNASGYLVTPKEAAKTGLIFDLSMPRLVDPDVARHPQIRLFNIEQIGCWIDARQERQKAEVLSAQDMVLTAVQRQVFLYHQKGLVCA